MIEELLEIEKSCKSVQILNGISQTFQRIPHNHINVLYLLREHMKDKCKNYLEIGTLWGASVSLAMQSKYECNFYCCDLFTEYRSFDSISMETAHNNITKCNRHNHFFKLIKGNSQNKETIDIIYNEIKDGIDILFIDGDHAATSVILDFNNYKELVNVGGFIVFDDYGFLDNVKSGVNSILSYLTENFIVIGQIDLVEDNNCKDETPKNASMILQKIK